MKLVFALAAAVGLANAAIPGLSIRVATYADKACKDHLEDVTLTFNQGETKYGGGPCGIITNQDGPEPFGAYKILTEKNPHPHYYPSANTAVSAFYSTVCDPDSYIGHQTFDDRGNCTVAEKVAKEGNFYGAGLRLFSDPFA